MKVDNFFFSPFFFLKKTSREYHRAMAEKAKRGEAKTRKQGGIPRENGQTHRRFSRFYQSSRCSQ